MFIEYLEKLRSRGKRYFTSQEIIQDLSLSGDAARAGLYRLKRGGKLISPSRGLYVIVPPEHKSYGSIPAEELMPIMMKHIDAEYYVALLSAAGFYSASHQKPMVFQVVTNRRIKHSLKFGQVHIKLIYKKSLAGLPIKDFVVTSGYLKVATPELIAIDLLKFSKHAGGMNNIATVLSELIENINVHKLIELAENLDERYQLQRLGYIIEKVDVMDDDIKKTIIDALAEYVSSHMKSYTPLSSAISRIGHPRCRKWKIIENTDFESDL
ncbi:MAG: type IV toxin-antitoxin system AbiEi family antitoxin [Proteobacteria bacterium]|nr:type IV toxin-antitoxin system AbiEi family antitoxin [Pseudomonadota bacterium]